MLDSVLRCFRLTLRALFLPDLSLPLSSLSLLVPSSTLGPLIEVSSEGTSWPFIVGVSGSPVVEFRGKNSPGGASDSVGALDVFGGFRFKDLEVVGGGIWGEGGERESGEELIVRGEEKGVVIFGTTTERRGGFSRENMSL